ncbi:MAG: MerR family transcriptional regulator [Proteobacteria bacterium]|nr:MerR family transcriptional regulator [Pseudomonadota bacterium]
MSEDVQDLELKELSMEANNPTTGGLSDGDVFLIGEFAVAVGMEPKTIRFYEKAGLMKPKRLGRMRVYRAGDVGRLKAIKYLRQIGLPIRQIKTLVERSDDFSMKTIATPEVAAQLSRHLEVMHRKHQDFENAIKDLSARLSTQAA